MSGNYKLLLAVLLGVLIWASWLFRYDFNSGTPMVLDRWTGKIYRPTGALHGTIGYKRTARIQWLDNQPKGTVIWDEPGT